MENSNAFTTDSTQRSTDISYAIAAASEPDSLTTKIDLIIRKNRPFSETEFARREAANILGVDTYVASAEDIILAKLEWAKDSASERQLRDIEGIIEIKADQLDRAYLSIRADRLGLASSLSKLSWPD